MVRRGVVGGEEVWLAEEVRDGERRCGEGWVDHTNNGELFVGIDIDLVNQVLIFNAPKTRITATKISHPTIWPYGH